MEHRTIPYEPFRAAYLRERAAIEAHRFSPGSVIDEDQLEELSDRLSDQADRALRSLLNTDFGRALSAEETLRDLMDRLESGLRRLTHAAVEADALTRDAPVMQWVLLEGFGAERAFHFWGRMGALFHYFRDLGGSLDTNQELALREQCRKQTEALLRQLAETTSHAAVHLVYKPGVIKRIEGLQATLETLNVEMQAPIDETLEGPGLLHGGNTVLRRQFAKSASFIAFELFGHLLPRDLDGLMTLKSSTAEALGFSAWWQTLYGEPKSKGSRDKDLRNYITAALKSGISRGAGAGWVTLPVLEFFSDNRELLFRQGEYDEGESY